MMIRRPQHGYQYLPDDYHPDWNEKPPKVQETAFFWLKAALLAAVVGLSIYFAS